MKIEKIANPKQRYPRSMLEFTSPNEGLRALNAMLIGITEARMRLAIALDAVVRRLVPNISATQATSRAEYPFPNPIKRRIK
jgi:hypothetical protein